MTQSNQGRAPIISDDELLDVVDENNQIIGQAPRRQVHQQGLRHRAAHILLFDNDGAVLLQQRSDQKDDFPGYWDASAAGHVDAGETYKACILREVKEELGIELLQAPISLFLIPASVENGMEFCQIYETVHPGPFYPDADEIQQLAWFTPEQCRHDPRRALFTPTLTHLLKHKGILP